MGTSHRRHRRSMRPPQNPLELLTVAAPRFTPSSPTDVARTYASPDSVPDAWISDRPGEIDGRDAGGARRGYQGPDQGYVLTLASRLRDRVVAQPGESVADALSGCSNIALRRASLFGRAPVIHDLMAALTMWGWFDASPSKEIVARRGELFSGLSKTAHHYTEGRDLVDLVPDATLRMTPAQVSGAYPSRWQELTGA